MKITLITATYNSEKNISDCLRSVAEQSYTNIEHLVIDGGSKDKTIEIVKSFPSVTKYISEPDKGIYDALNKGIQLATGDVIGFVHSDDMLASNDTLAKIANSFSPQEKENSASSLLLGEMSGVRTVGSGTERKCPQDKGGHLSQQGSSSGRDVRQLTDRGDQHDTANNSKKNEIDGVYGNLIFVDAQDTNKTVRTWISKPFQRKNIKNGWMPPHPALFLKKEVYEKYGLFDISFKCAGDYDFMLRVMQDKSIKLSYLSEVITKMRVGGVSTGGIKDILVKKKEDIRALKNNGFKFPFGVLVVKNLRKIPQLLRR